MSDPTADVTADEPSNSDLLLAAQETRQAAFALRDALNSRRRTIIIMLGVIVVIALLSWGFNAWAQYSAVSFNRHASGCLLEQMAEHRATNFDSHEQIAAAEGKTLTLDGARPPTDEVVSQLRKKFGKDCDHFSPLLVGQK